MPDLTNNRFVENPITLDIQRSVFNMDHSVKFTGDIGELIPFELIEVLPGDTFTIDTSKVVRLQPLVAPIMDDVMLDTYYFYVPTRLVWSHWKAFWGENELGPWYPTVEYTVPQLQVPSGGFDVGTIADYLGVPPKAGAGKKISALPFRCYAKVAEDWFRDENVMNPVNISVGDSDVIGVNTGDQVTDIQLGGKPFKVCRYQDYFSSCLPGAQKAAGPSVEFALRGLLPVNAIKNKSNFSVGDSMANYDPIRMYYNNSGIAAASTAALDLGSQAGAVAVTDQAPSGTFTGVEYSPYNLFADLNNTSVFDINSLRQAFAVQRYYEKLARGGSRYVEFIRSFFRTDCPDYRVQRSEYLGGSRLPLNVSQVEQTSATQSGLTPQGNITGISHTGEVHSDFTKSFTEHGYIIGVCCARYHSSYQQSVDRTFFRKTKFDYYNPTFANLGEQGVYEKEIYFDNIDTQVPRIFGYQEAWADYRFKPNRIAGQMRSVATTPLDMWHLADTYASVPYLSDSWMRMDKTMLDRCLAVTSSVSNQLIFDFYLQIKAARPMPLYSIPGLIDHH